LRGGGFKATLGRQVLNFGKGRLFSPADLFAEAEYSPLAVSRRGTDALRLTAELGPLALAEAIAAPAGDPASGRYALRAAGFVAGAADCSVIGAWDGAEGTWIAGGDAKLDLPFAAVYGEAAAAFPLDSGDAAYRAAFGFDASYGDLVAAAEYRYDGAPAAEAPYGAHSLYAALSLGLSEYASLSASGLWLVDRDTWSGGLVGKAEIEQGVVLGLSAAATRTLPAGIETWRAEAGFSLELRF
ncbi:MAG: hypothetical protein JNG85_08580, partial [Spirochaetaceae bacterium]|nr:hypothetical protein [Spirochaetaceae bacterium]